MILIKRQDKRIMNKKIKCPATDHHYQVETIENMSYWGIVESKFLYCRKCGDIVIVKKE